MWDIFHFLQVRPVKDVCGFISTRSCGQSPEAAGAPELLNATRPAAALLIPTQYLTGWLRGRPEPAARLAAPSARSRSAEGRKFGPRKKSEKDAEGRCVGSLRLHVRGKTKTVETFGGEAAERKANTTQNNEKESFCWLKYNTVIRKVNSSRGGRGRQ